MDFYLTTSDLDTVDQYYQYFINGYEDAQWYIIRRAFISASIPAAFDAKMDNMEQVLDRVDKIDLQFNKKCDTNEAVLAKRKQIEQQF